MQRCVLVGLHSQKLSMRALHEKVWKGAAIAPVHGIFNLLLDT